MHGRAIGDAAAGVAMAAPLFCLSKGCGGTCATLLGLPCGAILYTAYDRSRIKQEREKNVQDLIQLRTGECLG